MTELQLKIRGLVDKVWEGEETPLDVRQRHLGDTLESLFATVGITKERYAAIKEAVGLPPTCNCESRKLWLNSVGEKFGDAVSTALARLWG